MTSAADLPGANALTHCVTGNYEAARVVLESLTVEELAALRQGCADLDNEIFCLIETAYKKPKAGGR